MSDQNGMQVQLPDLVTLQLRAQDVVTIIGALHDAGPYKTVFPVVHALETQLMAQQIRPDLNQQAAKAVAAAAAASPPPSAMPTVPEIERISV